MQRNHISTAIKYSAYAGLMFFSLLVEKRLESDFKDFSAEEKDFLRERCQVGKVAIGLLVIVVLTYRWGIGWAGDRLIDVSSVLLAILITLQFWGLIAISLEKSLYSEKFSLVEGQKRRFLQLWVPYLSEKMRYAQIDFYKPHWWLKEAQLWRFLLMFALLFAPIGQVWGFVFVMMLLRVGSLMLGRDMIPSSLKIRLNRLYLVYVEELLLWPWVLWASWQKKWTLTFDMEMFYERQKWALESGFFQSLRWLRGRGIFLVLVAVTGVLFLGAWWKCIPLLWWLMRFSFCLSKKSQ